jgi:hypothetical protein
LFNMSRPLGVRRILLGAILIALVVLVGDATVRYCRMQNAIRNIEAADVDALLGIIKVKE